MEVITISSAKSPHRLNRMQAQVQSSVRKSQAQSLVLSHHTGSIQCKLKGRGSNDNASFD
eukprot:6467026-Amphidinium_carterae.2